MRIYVLMHRKLWYDKEAIESAPKGGWHVSWKGGVAMEVRDALTVMFMFGMFIIALLSYLKKK
ncbi:hypothetical protein PAECIP111802_04301 [Paenibacillus allorhizosphaerae]|uniref:Holin-like toxin n=1 Tax=Paenibacillus allorhizosphaerae TaxID=2849866 RepID=A0ABM8VLM7_9BACL|nr:putative holin-like toxin [Paenibacillus allorhizosphaerae]CAG7648714.1 hypothetical protein PAECIP111802_04301 [Paenibacillus allorhizosphaerae]